jgi:hypothetical protein
MSLRSIAILLLLAFFGGALVLGWFAFDSIFPWGETDSASKTASAPVERAAPAQITTFIPAQPVVADSAHTEAMLLSIAARRAVENGRPLDEYLPRLRIAFGDRFPQELAMLAQAGEQPLSNAALLAEFDMIAPHLAYPAGTGWDRMRYEAVTLFVFRRSDRAISPATARQDRVRQNLISGRTDTAVRLVRALPGAPNAADWIAKADKAIAVRKALDTLDQSAIANIVAPKQSLPPPVIPLLPRQGLNPPEVDDLPAGGE